MSAAQGLTAGVSAARRGLDMAWGNAGVRKAYARLVLALVVLTTVLDVAGVWAVVAMTRVEDGAQWWAIVLLVLLRIAGIGIVLLTAPIAAQFVVGGVFPFLGERVFLAGMHAVAPARAAELAALPGTGFVAGVINAAVRLALFLALSAVLLALAFVPVVGAVAGPVLQAWRSAVALSWELLDPYFDKLQLDRAAQRDLLRRHQRELLGFALPFTLVMAIPIVGSFMFGLAQAAIAVVVVEIVERPAA